MWAHIEARLNMHMHDKHGVSGWPSPEQKAAVGL